MQHWQRARLSSAGQTHAKPFNFPYLINRIEQSLTTPEPLGSSFNGRIKWDYSDFSSVAVCPCGARFLGSGGSAKSALDLLWEHTHHSGEQDLSKSLRNTYKREGYPLPDTAKLRMEDQGKASKPYAPRRPRVAFVHPTEGRGEVTQPFGANPRAYKQLGLAGHNGLDLGVREGTPVVAVCDGEVAFAGQGVNHILMGASAGMSSLVEHKVGKARFYTGYAHLSRLYVSAGQVVKAGDVIGLSGASGLTTGDHLHFELIPVLANGRMALDNGYLGRRDPAPYLEQGGCLWDEPGVPATEQGGA
ncbi:M23 family metallopeptidase [Glutamicibacter sp. AOP33-2CA-4]|uniref:M23 family metallopeptidase n=1 Tax=Glutamicibacter sp. AOP33-2CA-4 TaxID=3457690 RepID=UPI0040335C27